MQDQLKEMDKKDCYIKKGQNELQQRKWGKQKYTWRETENKQNISGHTKVGWEKEESSLDDTELLCLLFLSPKRRPKESSLGMKVHETREELGRISTVNSTVLFLLFFLRTRDERTLDPQRSKLKNTETSVKLYSQLRSKRQQTLKYRKWKWKRSETTKQTIFHEMQKVTFKREKERTW